MTPMTHAEYLAHPAYGSSDIIKMSKSFAYWKEKKERPDKPRRHFIVGTVFHQSVEEALTGKKADFRVWEESSSLTKAFKAEAEKLSVPLLDLEESALIKRMVKAVLEDTEAMRYLTGAIAEQSIITKFPGTDTAVKCRPDYLHMGRSVSVNLKSTEESSESSFIYAARDYSYDWQSAFYCAILTEEFKKPFDEVHILVEKGDTDAECVVNVFSFGDDTIAFARSQIWELLQHIPACEKSGVWPKKPSFLQTLDLPLHLRRVFHE